MITDENRGGERGSVGERHVLLVVERNADLRQKLTSVMTGILGLEVVEAPDVRAALAPFTHGRCPDLALVDLETVTSAEAIAGMKRALCDVPVIGMSLNGGREEAAEVGCDDLLPKPFLLEELADVLNRWLPAR